MRVMPMLILGFFFCGAGVGRAQDLAGLPEAERQQMNAWMAERAETMIRAHKLEGEVHGAWADTRYASAEIDALRARYRELQEELSRTQQEIQKKVLEVPAVQAKVRQLDEAKKKEQELAKRIEEKAGGKR